MKLLIRWQFALMTVLVIALQFFLLRVILNNGFTADDWLLLFDYKTASPGLDLLDKLYGIFHTKGIYTTYQVVYIGILESIFKGDYQAYQITNIILKTLATLSLYPLILIVFKKKSLAFLTTILYAISYSSSGALQFVVKGSDYLAIFFMNICLIAYYLSFTKKRKLLFISTTIFLFLSFIFSPIRIYPLFLFIILIELIYFIKSRDWLGFIFRLLLLFFPFLMILQFGPKSTGSYLTAPETVLNFISFGNYQLLLTPFAGLGYTFLPNDYWGLFGKVTFDNFKDYFSFLLHGPIIIYLILAVLIGFLLTKKPLMYILGIIFANVIFEIVSYFLVINLRGVTGPNVKGFYEISTYAVFFGFFVISVAISSFLVWLRKAKSNILLLSVFIGLIFSSIFLWGTWLIIGDNLTFKEGIHWYLIIPPIGSSLFLASLMVLTFDRIKNTAISATLKRILMICLFLLIIPIFLISSREINTFFTYLLRIGYGASEQEEMKSKLLSQIKEPLDANPALVYLDPSEESELDPHFYLVTVLSAFSEKMHFRDWEVINGCIGFVSDKDILKKSIAVQGGIKGFDAASLCIANYVSVERMQVFYKPENFYAFKLKNREVINIKEQMLETLKFYEN